VLPFGVGLEWVEVDFYFALLLGNSAQADRAGFQMG